MTDINMFLPYKVGQPYSSKYGFINTNCLTVMIPLQLSFIFSITCSILEVTYKQ